MEKFVADIKCEKIDITYTEMFENLSTFLLVISGRNYFKSIKSIEIRKSNEDNE